jgi:hypothetical protein
MADSQTKPAKPAIIGAYPADHLKFLGGMIFLGVGLVVGHGLVRVALGHSHVDLADLEFGGLLGFFIGWIWSARRCAKP